MQWKLQEIASSIRRPAYLPERMFPQLRERIGPALDLIVEFSTLGEYRLNADGVLCAASALNPAPEREPQMGGAGATRRRARCGEPHRRGWSGRQKAGRHPRGPAAVVGSTSGLQAAPASL